MKQRDDDKFATDAGRKAARALVGQRRPQLIVAMIMAAADFVERAKHAYLKQGSTPADVDSLVERAATVWVAALTAELNKLTGETKGLFAALPQLRRP